MLDKKWFILFPLLDRFENGEFISKVYFYFFRALAILAIIGGIVLTVQLMNEGGVNVVIGFFALFIAYLVAQIFLYRSDFMKRVNHHDMIITQFFSVLLKALGEVIGLIVTASMIIAGLFSKSLINDSWVRELDYINAYPVLLIIIAPIAGFLYLTVFYFLAEAIAAIPSIIKYSRKISRVLGASEEFLNSNDESLSSGLALGVSCKQCNHLNTTSANFCNKCGAKIESE